MDMFDQVLLDGDEINKIKNEKRLLSEKLESDEEFRNKYIEEQKTKLKLAEADRLLADIKQTTEDNDEDTNGDIDTNNNQGQPDILPEIGTPLYPSKSAVIIGNVATLTINISL